MNQWSGVAAILIDGPAGGNVIEGNFLGTDPTGGTGGNGAVNGTSAWLTASGVGSQFVVTDLNGDGAPDIVTSGPKGTFIFWNQMKRQR